MKHVKLRDCNWIHLDLKGAVPSFEALMNQLQYIRDYGYTGIIFEYEDRLKWKNWPELARQPFSRNEHRKLLEYCHDLGLETVPLIQTLGHLEWILKHEEYCHLRENNSVSELCPSVSGVREKLCRWIAEVLERHPHSRYLHIGGDEPFHLGTCPVCRKRAEASPYGKYSIYLEHMGEICRFVLERNVRPIIWADLFSRSGQVNLLSHLPHGVILAEWKYNGKPDVSAIRKMLATGHDVLGCAGICTGYYEHCQRIEERLDDRFLNINRWKKICSDLKIGRINAVWGRGSGLWEIYSPWHGHLPVIIHAGNAGLWEKHPWHRFFRKLNTAVLRDRPDELKQIADTIMQLPAASRAEQECLEYWRLALLYQRLVFLLRFEHSQILLLRAMKPYTGEDPMVMKQCLKQIKDLKSEISQWQESAWNFFHKNDISDAEEFITGRTGYLRFFLIN